MQSDHEHKEPWIAPSLVALSASSEANGPPTILGRESFRTPGRGS